MERTKEPGQRTPEDVVEELARHRLAAKGVEDHVLGVASAACLGCREEARADERALSAKHQRGRKAASVSDAACREHGHRVDHVDDLRHQRQRGHHADVAATLGPLRDHDVCTVRCHLSRFLRRVHLVDDLGACLVSSADQIAGASPRQGEDGNAQLDRHVDRVLLDL